MRARLGSGKGRRPVPPLLIPPSPACWPLPRGCPALGLKVGEVVFVQLHVEFATQGALKLNRRERVVVSTGGVELLEESAHRRRRVVRSGLDCLLLQEFDELFPRDRNRLDPGDRISRHRLGGLALGRHARSKRGFRFRLSTRLVMEDRGEEGGNVDPPAMTEWVGSKSLEEIFFGPCHSDRAQSLRRSLRVLPPSFSLHSRLSPSGR